MIVAHKFVDRPNVVQLVAGARLRVANVIVHLAVVIVDSDTMAKGINKNRTLIGVPKRNSNLHGVKFKTVKSRITVFSSNPFCFKHSNENGNRLNIPQCIFKQRYIVLQ